VINFPLFIEFFFTFKGGRRKRPLNTKHENNILAELGTFLVLYVSHISEALAVLSRDELKYLTPSEYRCRNIPTVNLLLPIQEMHTCQKIRLT